MEKFRICFFSYEVKAKNKAEAFEKAKKCFFKEIREKLKVLMKLWYVDSVTKHIFKTKEKNENR